VWVWLRKGVEVALAGAVLGLTIYGVLEMRAGKIRPSEPVLAAPVPKSPSSEAAKRVPPVGQLSPPHDVREAPSKLNSGGLEGDALRSAEGSRRDGKFAPASEGSKKQDSLFDKGSLFDGSSAQASGDSERIDALMAQLKQMGAIQGDSGQAPLDQVFQDLLSSLGASGKGSVNPSQLSPAAQDQIVRDFIDLQSLPPEAQKARLSDLAKQLGVQVNVDPAATSASP
jgi:hypothetical protein